MSAALDRLLMTATLACVASAASGQTTEQRLWRLSAGMSAAQGDELLAAAYQPGPSLYGAVDFITRSAGSMRSIGYFVEYARFAYDDGSFWATVRNTNGSTGGTVLKASAASFAAIGAVGKIGPVYGRLRPHASLSVGLFRNNRGDLTMPGLTAADPTQMKLGSKSGALAGVGAGVDFMSRRFGVTADAGYSFNWSDSKLDKRFQVCDGSDCKPASATSRTLVVRVGVALVRGSSG
jgi:hypothetical protein